MTFIFAPLNSAYECIIKSGISRPAAGSAFDSGCVPIRAGSRAYLCISAGVVAVVVVDYANFARSKLRSVNVELEKSFASE